MKCEETGEEKSVSEDQNFEGGNGEKEDQRKGEKREEKEEAEEEEEKTAGRSVLTGLRELRGGDDFMNLPARNQEGKGRRNFESLPKEETSEKPLKGTKKSGGEKDEKDEGPAGRGGEEGEPPAHQKDSQGGREEEEG